MMRTSLFLIAIASLLPGYQCQSQEVDDQLCRNMNCSRGEICRHIARSCELFGVGCKEVGATCVRTRRYRRGCERGYPVLRRDVHTGRVTYIRCSRYNRCPRDSHCSSLLPNRPPRCCYDFPTEPDASTVKEGICPQVTRPSNYNVCDDFVCDNDSTCTGSLKCCYTGCRKECVLPASVPPTLPSSEAVDPSGDPCGNMDCPENQVCKYYKACGPHEDCDVTAICTSTSYVNRCGNGRSPVLYDNNGMLDELWCSDNRPRGCREGDPGCHVGINCPSNAYCDSRLADASSVCCLLNPAGSS